MKSSDYFVNLIDAELSDGDNDQRWEHTQVEIGPVDNNNSMQWTELFPKSVRTDVELIL